jgi:hypothetical protein
LLYQLSYPSSFDSMNLCTVIWHYVISFEVGRDSSVSIVTRLWTRRGGVDDVIFFYSLPRSDRFWESPKPLYSGYRGALAPGSSGRGVKLTTHLHLIPRLRIRGDITPLPRYVLMALRGA